MATFKFVLDKYVRADGKQAINFRITINRQVIPRSTRFAVKKKDWDAANQKVRPTNTNHVSINDALMAKYEAAEREFALSVAQGYTPTAIAVADKAFTSHDFHKHAATYIESLTGPTQWRTQKGYQTTANEIKAFSPTLAIEQIGPDFIKSFRKYLENKPKSKTAKDERLSRTTVIKRLDQFRALYNQSAHSRSPSPFESVVIGEARPTPKEPLTILEVTALWNYKPESRLQRLAKDTFLLSFYALGMRMGDVFLLQWDFIKDGAIRYPQSKKEHLGDNVLIVPRNSYIDGILARWPKEGKYVFGLITESDPRRIMAEVEKWQTEINRELKLIALRVGITKWISGKLARSTFARIAAQKTGRQIYSIQQAMGHTKPDVTLTHYIGKDQEAVEEVARKTYGD